MSELTARANIEIARNIIAGLQSNISEMERFWPKSKRGSNAQRIWSTIAEQAAAVVTCLEDATARIDEAAAEIERLRSALAPLVPAFTAILAEAPRDSKCSDEFNLFTDCEGNEYCVTLDQIRAVVEIVRGYRITDKGRAAIGEEGGENTCGDRE